MEKTTKKELPKGFFQTTILIGLGFFTVGLMDPLYDNFVPLLLEENGVASAMWRGIILTIDNIFAILMIPIISTWSDKTRTPIGRRMPFIIVTLPLTALLFSLIPIVAPIDLGIPVPVIQPVFFLVITLFMLNIFKQSARGPVVALMPDTIPGEFRSEANGVINTMGGIAAIVGTVVLGKMYDLDIELPLIGNTRTKLPFIITGILVLIATILLFLFVKERFRSTEKDEEETPPPIGEALKSVFGQKEKSYLYILISIFLWFIAYQGILPFMSKYTVKFTLVSEGTSSFAMGAVAVAYALFAIPSGILGHKIGRKKVIRAALIAITVVCMFLFLHAPISQSLGLDSSGSFVLLLAILFFFGIFWATIATNSFPMLWQLANDDNMGVYTGAYYVASQVAAIVAPPIVGFFIDITDERTIFITAALAMFGAFLVMGSVKKGEAEESKESPAA